MRRVRPLLAFPAIVGIVGAVYLIAVALTLALGLPWELSLPLPVRVAGLALALAGIAIAGWTVRHRGFTATVESTYGTLAKLVRRAPIAAPVARTEPLVVAGPYRLVRHPMYSGVGLLAVGIALAVSNAPAALGALLLWAWFVAVLAPFEERELVALFGPAYEEYMRRTRRFLPIPRRSQK